MKKTILYLSLVSTLAIPQGMATEGEQNQDQNLGPRNVGQGAPEVARLQNEIARVRREADQERASKEALQQTVSIISEEQRETKEILNEVLTQHQQLLQGVPHFPPQANIVPAIGIPSPHQQQLLFRRGEIGEKAWSALGVGNHFSDALLQIIQTHPGKNVDVFYSGTRDFTLLVNGKVKDKIYKF